MWAGAKMGDDGQVIEWGFVLVLAAVAMGAVAQRVTGMGFALLAVPFLVLAVGPVQGVVLTNWCGVMSSGVNLIGVRRDVQWRRIALITFAAVLGSIPGALLIMVIPLNWLGIVVGSLTLLALLVSLRSSAGSRKDTRGLRASIGFASGFMGVTAGVSGPPMVIYRKATDWPMRAFASSVQFHFMIVGITAVTLKWGEGPAYSVWHWAGLVLALALGSFAGSRLAPMVPNRTALRLVMIIAFAGTLMTIGRAAYNLLVGA